MYFDNCQNLDELKALYKRLALKNHPDLGGDMEVMKAINAEYERVFEVLKYKHNTQAGCNEETFETADEFRVIIEKLIKIGDDIKIELCGSWLWISGTTYTHKEELKAAGCSWSRNKRMWYWHTSQNRKFFKRRAASISAIRQKYGSKIITAKGAVMAV